jgi:hypothetical protein
MMQFRCTTGTFVLEGGLYGIKGGGMGCHECLSMLKILTLKTRYVRYFWEFYRFIMFLMVGFRDVEVFDFHE